jgi:zinc transport system substrate-binding protein
VWLDPRKAAAMARRAAREIGAQFPNLREAVEARLRNVERRYARLDSTCAARLDPVREVPFVANHGGLNHLVARYGLRQVGVLEGSHGMEASPRTLKEMIARSRSGGARAIFVEPQSATRLAEAVSIETGIPRVEIDPLGMARPDLSYEEILLACVDRIATALAAEGPP